MKILFVNRHRDDVVGGSEIQCHLLASRFVELGHEAHYGVMQPRRTRGEYDHVYACHPLTGSFRSTFEKLLEEIRPDVVYWRFNKPHLRTAVRLSHASGAAFVFALSHDNDILLWPPGRSDSSGKGRLHATLRRVRELPSRIERAYNWLGHRKVDRHIAQHEEQAALIPYPDARVIRSSVLTENEPFSWPRPFVAWVGNLKPRKRPDAFVEVARRLANEPLDFLMVGSIQNAKYMGWDRPGSLPDNVHFLGTMTPAAANGVIGASRFLVLTCEPEGFPNVLMQAWNQERPTLTLQYDPDRLVEKNEIGIVAPDVPALSEAVRELFRDSERCQSMGARAGEFARQTFSVERNAARLEELCEELLVARHP